MGINVIERPGALAFADVAEACSWALADVADDVGSRLGELVPVIAASVHAALPDLPADVREATNAVCRTNTALAVVVLRREQGAPAPATSSAAAAHAREFARRGLPVELLLAVHRVWHSAFEHTWLLNLRSQVSDRGVLAAAIARGSASLFALVDALASQAAAVHAAESADSVWTEMAKRQREVAAILAGAPVDQQRVDQLLHYPLEGHHLAFVAWHDDEDDAEVTVLMEVADTVRRAVGGDAMLCVPAGQNMVHAWVAVSAAVDVALAGDALAESLRRLGAHVAFGEPSGDVSGFRSSHVEALRAHQVALMRRQTTDRCSQFGDVRLLSLLTHDRSQAEQFIEQELGELRADTEAMRCLLRTLRVFLAEGSSYMLAGRALGVHKNTVHNRVKRASALLPRPIDHDVVRLHIALTLHQALQP